jgi:spore coat polysaccharide biosynthesis protein SpsF
MNLCIIQARMGSTRLPGKVLMDVSGKPILQQLLDRLKPSQKIVVVWGQQ